MRTLMALKHQLLISAQLDPSDSPSTTVAQLSPVVELELVIGEPDHGSDHEATATEMATHLQSEVLSFRVSADQLARLVDDLERIGSDLLRLTAHLEQRDKPAYPASDPCLAIDLRTEPSTDDIDCVDNAEPSDPHDITDRQILHVLADLFAQISGADPSAASRLHQRADAIADSLDSESPTESTD